MNEMTLLEKAGPRVVFCPHPLMPWRERQLIYAPPRPHERLDVYLSRVIGVLPEPCVVTVGDCRVPSSAWPLVTVKPGVVIGVAVAVAGGDSNGGSNVGRVIATIAVMVASYYTGGAVGAAYGAGWGAVAGAAVSFVGMMAVNALFPFPTQDLSGLSGESTSPTYSLSGGSNRVRRYEPLPLVIGTHRMFPDQACAGYTLYVNGADQYLFIAFNWGFGDLLVGDLRIGDTSISDYNDVTLAWAVGSMPPLVAGNVDTQAGTTLTADGGAIVRTTSVDTTEIQIDLQYVMFYAGDSGITTNSATVQFEWRATGEAVWQPFSNADGSVTWFGTAENTPFLPFDSADGLVVLSSSTRAVWRRTLRKTVAKGQYDVRITKLTADSTDDRATCEISVPAIRSLQPDEGDYSGQLILGLKIRASQQLNGTVNQLSGLVIHRLGGVATSNPAKWFKAFALGSFHGSRRIWGAGLAVDRLDVAALDAWATWCDAKGLSCDMVLDSAASAATVLDRIARCGRASKTWAPGALSAVWDAEDLPVMAMFSPVNIRRGSFSISYPSEELADELELSYINPDNNWQRDSVRVPVGATNVRRTASVELLGCTSTALAGREANLMYAQNLYRFRTITWEADAEGLTVRKGDVVALSHDLTSWGEAGRLVAVASSTALTLDRTITLNPAGCWMAVCRPTGEISYHRVQVGAAVGQADEVTLLDPLPITPSADGSPAVDWRYLADAKATPGWRVKITEVTPLQGMEGVKITAQDDPAEYYAAESGLFAHVAAPAASNLPVLSGLQVSEELVRAGTGYAVQLKLSWSAAGNVDSTRVRFKIDGGPWQEGGFATGTQQTIPVPDTGTVVLEVTAFNGMGQSNLRSRLSGMYEIQGQAVPPPVPSGFGVTTTADGTRVATWAVVTVPPDVTYLELRYTASSGVGWEAMNLLGRVPFGSGRAESNAPPMGSWTFEARLLDASGNYSSSGARVTVTLPDAPTVGAAGVNRLYNSSASPIAPTDDGWGRWTNYSGGIDGVRVKATFVLPAWNSWAMPSGSSRCLNVVGAADASIIVDESSSPQALPVTAGQRIEGHALMGAHRCTGRVMVIWTNSAGAYVGESVLGDNAAESPGGVDLASWKRTGGFAVAPPGATRAVLVSRLLGMTGADAYVFWDQAYLGFADALQTALSPWADGARPGAETIAGAQAKADAAHAAAVAAAEADATAKANLAEVTAKAYADGVVDAEEARAIADATNKASAAHDAAVLTAAADATAKANLAATTATWSGVTGSGKPIDSAGQVLDGGSGTGTGQRNANDPTSYYPVGITQQFKRSDAVGLSFSEWGILRTERPYGDDNGGPMTQTWKSSSGEWKRTGTLAGGWGAWSRRVDRPISAANAADFVMSGAIGTAELDGTATYERVVLFDAVGVTFSNIA